MDVITETSLEALLQRATDYRNKSTDTAAIDAFCGIIKKEQDGPLIATRLIATKIQSTEEWEALQGLTVLETCMKNCGPSFHSEVGKFRFLNEMIKLVSPKFLGSKTPASVKNQVLKMMYSWTLNYPNEHKIKEAYDMLIKQGVIHKDDVILPEDDSKMSVSHLSPKANPLFQDEEKVRLLQKLLHSKNPDDLQAANRLIKTMVKEDEKRVEIKSKKISEVETVRNNARLLSEMLDSYKTNQTSSEELELIKDLFQGCEKLKTNIVRLASDTQDNDDLLSQVLSVGDELNQVLEKYKDIIVLGNEVSHSSEYAKQESSLLDLSSPVEEFVPLNLQNDENCLDILGQTHSSSGLTLRDPIDAMISATPEQCLEKSEPPLNPIDAIFASISSQNNTGGVSFIHSLEHQQVAAKPLEKSNKLKALEELDVLGETLLQQCKINAISKASNKTSNNISEKKPEKMEEIASNYESTNRNTNLEDDILMDLSDDKDMIETDIPKQIIECESFLKKEVKPLTDVFMSLESIKPSSIPPISVIEEKNGISVRIHIAKDTPREDVTVFVVTTLSKNPSPLSNYLFQAVVPKGCKLKLQPPSGSELPAHNPFLPPSAITQIMLIANPNKLNVTLKCMISYTMDEETVTEMGEVEKLPTTT